MPRVTNTRSIAHRLRQVRGINSAMNRENLHRWLEAYGRAWESLDPWTAAELFTDDATYQETPFVEPTRGRAAILEDWKNVARTQENVRFEFEILAWDGAQAIAHWKSRFARLPVRLHLELDGIFVLAFDAQGRCRTLREW
jgi:SnoaL-like domain